MPVHLLSILTVKIVQASKKSKAYTNPIFFYINDIIFPY